MFTQLITVSRFDGTSRTERAIEVTDSLTGNVLAIVRKGAFENAGQWMARALKQAEAR